MEQVHRLGVTALSPRERGDEQRILNIIFVHGLRGHPRKTWEDTLPSEPRKQDRTFKSWFKPRPSANDEQQSLKASSVFWPEEYLTSDIPQARIWTYGYNADVIGGVFQANNRNSITQHGKDLAVKLERDIENTDPLVFVAHSLGGIVVKHALHYSTSCCARTKLVVFLGTPHRGSSSVTWGQIASNLAALALQDSNDNLLRTLDVNSEVLDMINEEFKNVVYQGKIKIHSFQEARAITGIKGLHGKVVDDFSSKLDLPKTLETVETIDADHRQMARSSSKDDARYRAILGVLKHFIRSELAEREEYMNNPESSCPQKLFTVPFQRDDNFVGRKAVLAEIYRRHQKAVSRTHTRIALVGMGGVGKSQIAIEYAYRTRQSPLQISVFWIYASNTATFEQAYRDLADRLNLPGRDDPAIDIFRLVYRWLSDEKNGQWLMILDNADDDGIFFDQDGGLGETQMPDAIPKKMTLIESIPQTKNGSVIVTSRSLTAAMSLIGIYDNIISVGTMDETDALDLLATKLPLSRHSADDAKTLVKTLDCIPLAITQAGSYIQMRSPRMTISTYLNLLRESEANLAMLLSHSDVKDLRRDHSSQHAVLATWQISFEQIRESRPEASDLLALMSMFHRQGIPEYLLRGNISQLQFEDAVTQLINFSLIKNEKGHQLFEMHRLVQISMRKWLESNNQLEQWSKKSAEIMAATFPEGEYETWRDCQVLLPHAKEIMHHISNDKETLLNWATLAHKAGRYLFLKGRYQEAEAMHQRAVKDQEKVLGPENLETLASVSSLGLVVAKQGKYNEAEAIYRQALKDYTKVLGPEHRYTLTCGSSLGWILAGREKYEEAEVMHRRALSGFEKVLGPEHPDTLAIVSNLGSTLERQGKYKEAEAMHRRDLEASEKLLGPEHPDTLASVNNISSLLRRQGKYKEAEAMYRQALNGYKKVLGPEHPNTLTAICNLGRVLESQGKYKEAEAMYRQALNGFKKVLRPEHPDILDATKYLSSVLTSQGKCQNTEVQQQ